MSILKRQPRCRSYCSSENNHRHIYQCEKSLIDLEHIQAFENTSTSVAASQMRNALNGLSDTVKDPAEKQVSALQFYAQVRKCALTSYLEV